MTDVSKGIVKYTSRDYQSLLADFWSVVPTMTELWKPEADSDPGVVLGKYLASVADMLGVNVDLLANELFAPSVSQRKNAEKLFGLIGYELGWFRAARTEITFTNNSGHDITLDFGFNGANFCTVNAYTDITNQSRVITYNILPKTNTYGSKDSRSRRVVTTENLNVFDTSDPVTLAPGKSVTRVGIEGELRSYSVSVDQVKRNNFIINIPSQHIDTTAIWIKAKASSSSSDFLATQWIQCATAAEFVVPEPRFAVTYDSYSNAQIQISNYLNQLENYENNYLTVYWIDCSGVIGCVGENVLSNYLQANGDSTVTDSSGDITISNLSNTVELPHTYTVTGRSPETAKEAYYGSRNYINTWDSLITLPDFNRFLNREPGVDCGVVIDCQKALEINMAIYEDENLTDSQKSKMYITNNDFPVGDTSPNWTNILSESLNSKSLIHLVAYGETVESIANDYEITPETLMSFNDMDSPSDLKVGSRIKIPGGFSVDRAKGMVSNFKTYTAMCFAIHNDFKSSAWGQGKTSSATNHNYKIFTRYKPPAQFIDNVVRDYRPLQAMSVELQFGYVRVFPFYIVGQIYPKRPVSQDVANNIIARVKEALAMYFAPANRAIGQKPTVMEIVNVVRNADSRIDYFDAGSLNNDVIKYFDCDPDWFNYISFARFSDPGVSATNIRVNPEYIVK
jgi:LysM repeat protein